MRGREVISGVRRTLGTLARSPMVIARRAARGGLERTLRVVADRWNYFLVIGMYHPDSRFDHRPFLRGSGWRQSRDMVVHATIDLLRRELTDWGVEGAVAEVGVCRGMFAAKLNQYFPERTLYLFDTFAGFDARDVAVEVARGRTRMPYRLPEATVEEVRSRLPHPEKAEFRVGWFPSSAAGCESETFSLVNIDVGLYQPTHAALRWFYPRLAAGGYLLVTDYNNAHCEGVREAVHQFARETGIAYTVLPDYGARAVIAKPKRYHDAGSGAE
jgi:O-methyltransferase